MKEDTKYKAIAGAFLVFGLTVIFVVGGMAISQKHKSYLVENNLGISATDNQGAYVDVDKCGEAKNNKNKSSASENPGYIFDPVTSGLGLGFGSPNGGGSWGD